MTGNYQSLPALSRRFEETEKSCAFSAADKREYAAWKRRTRRKLAEITGLDRLRGCDLCPELLGTEELPAEPFYRHKMRIQTEEGVWMPFYLLEPRGGPAVKPAVICTHGHDSGGKMAVAGCPETPEAEKRVELYHYEYGIELAKRGFLVFCPDARGFGERQEIFQRKNGDILLSSCRELNNMAISLGLSVTGMWVFDLMRLVDYIESRPDCGKGRIGVTGLSGGGLQSLWLAAMDDRIRAAAVSGYFYGYHDALLLMSDNCCCNYVPHLWETADMGDIAALAAPRALLIETGNRDPLNGESGLRNVITQLDITRRAYRLFGAEHSLVHSVCDGEHRWYGRDAIPFLVKELAAPETV